MTTEERRKLLIKRRNTKVLILVVAMFAIAILYLWIIDSLVDGLPHINALLRFLFMIPAWMLIGLGIYVTIKEVK